VVDLTGGDEARDLCEELRRSGLSADRAFDGRSPKAQLKLADRSGARLAIIVGPDEKLAGEVTLREMRTGGSQRRVARADVVAELTRTGAVS
jgi:histidyl-tRNA synthetase